jgi:hypothetical protein
MAWSANLVSAVGNQSNVVATVQFTSSTTSETFQRQVPGNNLTPYNLASFCATVIAQLNLRDQLIGTLRPGPVVLPP